MEKAKLTTVAQALEAVGVKSTAELGESPEAQAKLIQIAAGVTPEVLKSLLATVPDLAQAFRATISAMEGIGKSLEESKRLRWEVLRDLAKSADMTGDQILESLRIIQEIEAKENVDWSGVFKTALHFVGGALGIVAIAVAWILSGGRSGGRRR